MVSDRKRDVVDMLKHFNIKSDSPLVCMEQTTMKQFIQGDEKTKYDVLMQALNFRSLEQNFTVTEDNLLNMNETLKRYKDVELGKKREERDKAQDELRAVEHLRTRQEQIVEMEKRVAWAEVQEYETEIEGIEGEIHQLETTMEVLNRDIATDQEKLKELEMSSEQFQQQLNGIMNDMSLQMEESEKVEKEMQAVIGPRDDADVKIREKTRQRAQLLRQAEASRAQVQKLSKEILALANNTGKRQEMDRLRSLMAASEEEQRKGQESIAGLEEEETRLAGIQEDVENRLRDATMAASRADEAVREDRKREQELVNARVNANSRPHEANALREAGVQSDWNLPPREGRVQGMDSGAGDLSGPTAVERHRVAGVARRVADAQADSRERRCALQRHRGELRRRAGDGPAPDGGRLLPDLPGHCGVRQPGREEGGDHAVQSRSTHPLQDASRRGVDHWQGSLAADACELPLVRPPERRHHSYREGASLLHVQREACVGSPPAVGGRGSTADTGVAARRPGDAAGGAARGQRREAGAE